MQLQRGPVQLLDRKHVLQSTQRVLQARSPDPQPRTHWRSWRHDGVLHVGVRRRESHRIQAGMSAPSTVHYAVVLINQGFPHAGRGPSPPSKRRDHKVERHLLPLLQREELWRR